MPARNMDNYDPLYKVRPLLDHIRHVCQTVYKPKRQLSVDEAMVGYRGRIFMKQYMRNKPTSWGLKVWCCAEAKTGYVLNFRVYTGKRDYASGNGLGYDVVMSMSEPYLDKYHEFFLYNFFRRQNLQRICWKERPTAVQPSGHKEKDGHSLNLNRKGERSKQSRRVSWWPPNGLISVKCPLIP